MKKMKKKLTPKSCGHKTVPLDHFHSFRIILRSVDTIQYPHTNQDPTLIILKRQKIVGVLFLDRFDGFNGLYLNISIYFLYVHVHFKRIMIWLSLFVLSPPCKKREGCNSKGTTPAISRTSAKSRCCTWSKFCPVPKVFKMCENPYIWG